MSDTGLLNALIDETLKYTSLISTRRIYSEEYKECKKTLEAIQKELDTRHPHLDKNSEETS